MQRPLAVITGASPGIGRELARLAARDGYDLIIAARREDRLTALASELTDIGATIQPVVADLAQRAEHVDVQGLTSRLSWTEDLRQSDGARVRRLFGD